MNLFKLLFQHLSVTFFVLLFNTAGAQEQQQRQFINVNFINNDDNVRSGLAIQLVNRSGSLGNPFQNRVKQHKESPEKNNHAMSLDLPKIKRAEKVSKTSSGKRVPFKYRQKPQLNWFAANKRKPKAKWVKKNKSSKKECAFLASR